jgi:uncharacterized protein YbjT (DUF2867 family)
MNVNAIITGATGMVGEGVLHECLRHPDVAAVLVINRRPCGIQHPKLQEIIHADFYDFTAINNRLTGYNACFFCMGVSSIGMKEDKYRSITYDITLALATVLAPLNPNMVFNYVSGAGTDSTEKGRSMWARVKGKTENDVMALPFRAAYMFRPGYIQPTKGLTHTYTAYKILSPLYPVLRFLFPRAVCSLTEIGLAMIHSVTRGYDKKILGVKDIVQLAAGPAV